MMLKSKYTFSFLLLLFFIVSASAQCVFNDDIEIKDNDQTVISMDIDGMINNDLATNNGICGVEIDFKHGNLGDLTIKLVSPAGQEVELIGPSGAFGSTSFTRWNISFLPCGQPVIPDVGFNEQWSNDQFWGAFGDFSGSYHPFDGCLEDFNTGPANGIWRLVINDSQNFDDGIISSIKLIFCNPVGISCEECISYSGEILPSTMVVACVGADTLNFSDLDITFDDPSAEGEVEESFVVHENNQIHYFGKSVDLSNYPAGLYEVCGITHTLSDFTVINDLASSLNYNDFEDTLTGSSSPICGLYTSNCRQVSILDEIDTTIVEVYKCENELAVFKGVEYVAPGTYYQTISAVNGCDSTYQIEVKGPGIIAVASGLDSLNCEITTITLSGEFSLRTDNVRYRWSTIGGAFVGPRNTLEANVISGGLYILELIDNGCVSTDTIEVVESKNYPEFDPTDPTINCNASQVFLNSGYIDTYDSLRWTGPAGFSSNDLMPSVSIPGTYQLVLKNRDKCIDSTSITVSIDTVSPEGIIDYNNARCEDEMIELSVSPVTVGLNYQWTGPDGFTSTDSAINQPIDPGQYRLSVTDPINGCTSVDSVEVLDLQPVPVVQISIDTIDCFKENVQINTTALGNYTYSWRGPSGFRSSLMEPVIQEQGLYNVTITAPNGCTLELSEFLIRNTLQPSVSFRADSIDCQPAVVEAIPSRLPVTYEWEGPAGFISQDKIISADVPGTYQVTITSPGGCIAINSIEINKLTPVPAYEIEFIYDTLSCDSPIVDLTYDFIGPLYQVDSIKWFRDTTEIGSTDTVSIENGGWYKIWLYFDNGCIGTEFFNMESFKDTPEIDVMVPPIDCNSPVSQVSLTTQEDIQVRWVGPNGFQSSALEPVFSEFGTYYLSAVNNYGCEYIDSFELIRDTMAQEVSLSALDLGCTRTSVRINTTVEDEPSEYSWEGPGNFSSTAKSPRVDMIGVYKVIVTGPNGCVTLDSIEIGIDTLKPIGRMIVGDTLNCIDKSALLSVSVDTTDVGYRWESPSGKIGSRKTFVTDEIGSHFVIVTSPNTCTDTVFYNVIQDTVIPPISFEIEPIICNKDSSILNLITDYDKIKYIEWSGPDGFSSSEFTPVTYREGEYYVYMEFDNKCIADRAITVQLDTSAPVFNFDTHYHLNCNNRKDTINPSVDLESNLIWKRNGVEISRDSIYEITQSGNYTIEATAYNECVASTAFSVTMDTTKPHVTLGVEPLSCKKNKTQMSVSGHKNSYSYNWIGPDNFETDEREPYVILPGFYDLITIDTNGCTSYNTISVATDTLSPVIAASDTILNCRTGEVSLSVASTDSISTIRWFGPDDFFSDELSPLVTLPGVYYVQVYGKNGCIAHDTINVYDRPNNIELSFEYYLFNCYSDSILVKAVPSGSFARFDYEWDISSLPGKSPEYAYFIEDGTFPFRLVDTMTECAIDTTITIMRDSLRPVADIEPLGRLVCDNNAMHLSGLQSTRGDSINYSWTTDEGIFIDGTNTLMPEIQGPGLYILSITNTRNNCTSSDSITIEYEETDTFAFDLNIVYPRCTYTRDGALEVLNISGGNPPYSYSLDEGPYGIEPQFYQLSPKSYNLSIKDRNGCIVDSTITFENPQALEVSLPRDTIIDRGSEVSITPVIFPERTGVSPSWKGTELMDCVNCFENNLSPAYTTFYILTATDSRGCVDSDTIQIVVRNATPIYMPTAFSPNGDQKNDIIHPYGPPGDIIIKSLRIYDRTGNLVFQNDDFPINSREQGWDGNFHGEPMNPQVFTYVMEVDRKGGRSSFLNGTITLLR